MSHRAPLSFSQESLWLTEELLPGLSSYVLAAAWEITGDLDGAALGRAIGHFVDRHELLRSELAEVDGRPTQTVRDHVGCELGEIDLTGLPEAAADGAVRALFRRWYEEPFSFRPPLLHAELIRRGAGRGVLVLVTHHIVSDELSQSLMLRELSELYAAELAGREPELPDPEVQYADYAQWQREEIEPGLAAGLRYWSERLADLPAGGPPTDRPRPPVRRFTAGVLTRELDPALVRRVDALARNAGTTPYAVYLAAFGALLGRWAATPRVVVGTPVSGRSEPELENVFGFFVNNVVLPLHCPEDESFDTLLRRVTTDLAVDLAHQDVPFHRVVEAVNPPRDLGRHPLYQVALQVVESDTPLRLPGVRVTGLTEEFERVSGATTEFDLLLDVVTDTTGPRCVLRFAEELFDERTVEAVADAFVAVLTNATTTPEASLGTLFTGPDGAAVRLSGPAVPYDGSTARGQDTALTARVTALWTETLGTAAGPDEDFFALGGSSLTAARLVQRLRTELGVRATLVDLFEAGTLRRLLGLPALRRAAGEDDPGRGDPVPAGPGPDPRGRPDPLPLSYAQNRLWFLNRLGHGSAAYNVPLVLRMTGELDVPALRAALHDLVARHESLRTVFEEHEGQPVQRVLDPGEVPLALDIETVAPETLGALLREAGARWIDLADGIPWSARLLRTGERDWTLSLLMHHIVADGWSMAPLLRDLAQAYTARREGRHPGWPPLTTQYADHALRQRAALAGEDGPGELARDQLAFWRERLDGIPEQLELRPDLTRSTGSAHDGATVDFAIDAETHRMVLELARRSHCSVFMVMQTALAATLTRFGAGTDIPLGTPVAGRPTPDLDDVVGFFVNTLVLRTDTSGNPGFRELLDRVRALDLAAFEHQDLPFEHLVEMLNPTRSFDRNPLFQVMLVFQNTPSADAEFPGLDTRVEWVNTGTSLFDLVWEITERHTADGAPDGLAGALDHSTGLFTRESALRLTECFGRLLADAVRHPDRPLRDLDILGPEQYELVVSRFNGADPVLEHPAPTRLFEEQVRRTPHATALVHGEEAVDYAELNTRANRLAHHLIGLGAGPERRVALALEKSTEMIVAVLAVMKTGAAFVPLGIDDPEERVAYTLGDAAPSLLVTTTTVARRLPPRPAPLLLLDDPAVRRVVEHGPVTDPEVFHSPHTSLHPAYIVYTSGTTGRPKGLLMPGGVLSNLVTWMAREMPGGPGTRHAQLTTLTFDISSQEIFFALTTGRTLVVPDEDVRRDPVGLARWLARHAVNELLAPNLVINALCEAAAEEGIELPELRDVVQGGERLVLGEAARNFFALPGHRLHNHYGTSEVHVISGRELPDPEQYDGSVAAPIGGPLTNARYYVLDDRLRPVPVGVTGELHIGGTPLARGYLNRPAMTAGRFVADPFAAPGARMYRTGDLVRWRPDGGLDYLDRTDHQVKVRGFRIEPAEIEAVLAERPDVRAAAVLVREDRPGDRRIVAYVQAGPGIATGQELRRHTARHLPDYMVPSAVVVLDSFPLTSNGKLDRSALPAPRGTTPGSLRRARHPEEELVRELFADVLGVETVGFDDGFFELGGHSLLAMRLVSRIRRVLGRDVPVRELFEAPTPAALAERLRGATLARTALVARPRPAELPLSYAQQRLWFLWRMGAAGPAYNIPLCFGLSGALPTDRLAEVLGRAVQDVVDRHESLRTRFVEHEGRPRQEILSFPDGRCPLDVVTVTGDADDAVTRTANAGFDLSAEIPVRATLFVTGPQEHVLLLVVHHIAADGWSLDPLARDLATAFTARLDDREPQWDALVAQYADYTLWQRELLGDAAEADSVAAGQLSFWRKTLDGIPEEIALPADRPRPALPTRHGATVPLTIDPALHRRLVELARRTGTTLFMVLQSALATLLTRLGAGTDIPVGTAVAGRGDEALDELVGFFVNSLVLRTDTSGAPSFEQLLARTRETDLAAFEHQDMPFEHLVEMLNPRRSLSRHPLFQVMLVLQNNAPFTLDLPGLVVTPREVTVEEAKVDLVVHATERSGADGAPDGVDVEVQYSTELFDEETVRALARRLGRVLRAAADDPGRSIEALDILDDAERDRIGTWSRGPEPYRARHTLPELFAAQVRRTPDRPALEEGDESITYAELDRRVERLADCLRALGAAPEERVAVLLPRSAGAVVSLLAVTGAGAAFLPIDPEQPRDRVAAMLADARPVCVVTGTGTGVPVPPGIPRVVLGPWGSVESVPVPVPGSGPAGTRTPASEDHAAYVIYTSGSTGRPKGVVVTHAGIADLAGSQIRRLGVEPDSRVLACASVSFDASIFEWGMALLSGARLVLAPAGRLLGEDLAALLRNTGATHVTLPPAVLETLPENGVLPGTTLIVVGEACRPGEAERWFPGRVMVNAYGPTETTVCATMSDPLTDGGKPPIGRPVSGTRVYVLDERLRPVPPGVPGELHVAGAGLARGYLGRPDLTAGRFVADPFAGDGSRMYRSGDLVRWRADGQLDFLGRTDDQISLHGLRIEPGEIQAALRAVDGVRGAVVVRHETPKGDARLIAYVVPDGTGDPTPNALRRRLARTLPAAMVPSGYVLLDGFPLNRNGKLDRAALPDPGRAATADDTGPQAPGSGRTAVLCGLFADALSLDHVGPGDDFFDLGGHSLLAVRLISRIKEVTGADLGIRALFEAPTPAALAQALAGLSTGSAADDAAPVIPLRSGGEGTPLFCVHPAAGVSWMYAGLLRHLAPGAPVYGVQTPALSRPDWQPLDWDGTIEEYLRYIREVRPRGPYRLLGWSFGGATAHALAVRLQEQGEQVELLALMDAYPGGAAPGRTAPRSEREVLAALARSLGRSGDNDPVGPTAGGGGEGDEDPDTGLIRWLSAQYDVLGRLDADRLGALARVFRHHTTLAEGFRPACFDGDILFFAATGTTRGADGAEHTGSGDPVGRVLDPAVWERHCTGHVEIHEIEGEHGEMTRPTALARIGPVLAARMTEPGDRPELEEHDDQPVRR
ncbi:MULTISPECIES: amino acid adenylation domain-containing protein [unclassified Streptomyces]|uniref:amino acid adenylation domain-containing protein n=1 Tax=unclassified Streptomyces TaxID=2593676 RepID=UPI0035E29604